jgi:hypothetical protein
MNDPHIAADINRRDDFTLLRPECLLPTEEFIEARVLAVWLEIEAAGCWRYPVWVERRTGIIMDGHHRREFALRRGYTRVPCLVLDYSQVILESRRPDVQLTPEVVISRGLAGCPFPPKTTRHSLRDSVACRCEVSLDALRDADLTDNVLD